MTMVSVSASPAESTDITRPVTAAISFLKANHHSGRIRQITFFLSARLVICTG